MCSQRVVGMPMMNLSPKLTLSYLGQEAPPPGSRHVFLVPS
jgi:hypothetical protein